MVQYFLPHGLSGGDRGAVLGDCGGCGAEGRAVRTCYKQVTNFLGVKYYWRNIRWYLLCTLICFPL